MIAPWYTSMKERNKYYSIYNMSSCVVSDIHILQQFKIYEYLVKKLNLKNKVYVNQHDCLSDIQTPSQLWFIRGGKTRRAREHCSQAMLNSCRKFVWMKVCYWKFEGNLNTHMSHYGCKQHMVDIHYPLNLRPWSARTLYVYAHAD